MRSAALASSEIEDDEVPVSSIEVLEANVIAIRSDLNELKNDFRAAVARIDNDIKNATQRLQDEIRAVAAKAERDLQQFSTRMETQLAEMRAESKAQFSELRAEDRSLRDRIDATNDNLRELDRKFTVMSSKLTALIWVAGGLGTLILISVTVGNAFHWFDSGRQPAAASDVAQSTPAR